MTLQRENERLGTLLFRTCHKRETSNSQNIPSSQPLSPLNSPPIITKYIKREKRRLAKIRLSDQQENVKMAKLFQKEMQKWKKEEKEKMHNVCPS